MNTLTSKEENLLTIQHLIGLDEEAAGDILTKIILITFDNSDESAKQLVNFIKDILLMTVSTVRDEKIENPDIEIIVNNFTAESSALPIYVYITEDNISISSVHQEHTISETHLHSSFLLLAAAYVAAFTLRHIIGECPKLPHRTENIVLNFNAIFPNFKSLPQEINLDKIYLAGGGAIGNAFLYALKGFNVYGELIIADGDNVSKGNLNRCILFNESNIGKNKAEVLVEVAKPFFPNLVLKSHNNLLQSFPEKKNNGKWLRKLVVAVDSRRARRSLQSEIPGEVFDASTTDISEIVFHFHKRPLADTQCLECAYYHDNVEEAHAKHMADMLGISHSEIKEGYVTDITSQKILAKYPEYASHNLVGQSFDTLFKEMCGKGHLKIEGEKQILAPFAFVSIIAGTVLAIETVCRIATGSNYYNSWRISPWVAPMPRLQRNSLKNSNCSFCNNKLKSKIANELWR